MFVLLNAYRLAPLLLCWTNAPCFYIHSLSVRIWPPWHFEAGYKILARNYWGKFIFYFIFSNSSHAHNTCSFNFATISFPLNLKFCNFKIILWIIIMDYNNNITWSRVNTQMMTSLPSSFTLSSLPLIDRVCVAKACPGRDTNSLLRLCECWPGYWYRFR